jgi:hypothetical protein
MTTKVPLQKVAVSLIPKEHTIILKQHTVILKDHTVILNLFQELVLKQQNQILK